jgi:hypothetical protein
MDTAGICSGNPQFGDYLGLRRAWKCMDSSRSTYLHYTLDDWEHDKREADRIIALRAAEINTEHRAG